MFAINPFESVSFLKTERYGAWTENFAFELNNPTLKLFELNSVSTIYNTASFFAILIFVAVLHFLVYWSNWIVSSWRGSGWWARIWKKFIFALYKVLTFGYYIRLLMEINEFVLVSSINEVNSAKSFEGYLVISFGFAVLLIIGSLVWIIVALFLSLSSYQIIDKEHNKLSEFFNGFKAKKNCRIWIVILLIRRLFFISILILLSSVNSKIIIGVLAVFDAINIIFIIWMRPYEESKDNFLEIVNRFLFLTLLGSLIYYNSERDWTVLVAYMYMSVVLLIWLIDFLVINSK